MPKYKIEQFEVHTMCYTVEASSEAEAIKKLFESEAQPLDGSLEFIEVCDELGLPVESYPDLAESLTELGVNVDEDIISSIRSIELVEEHDVEQGTIETRWFEIYFCCYRCGHKWDSKHLGQAVFSDCPECHARNVSPFWFEPCE